MPCETSKIPHVPNDALVTGIAVTLFFGVLNFTCVISFEVCLKDPQGNHHLQYLMKKKRKPLKTLNRCREGLVAYTSRGVRDHYYKTARK